MHGINKVVPQLLMFIQLFEMNCTYERCQVLVHNKIYYDSICPKGCCCNHSLYFFIEGLILQYIISFDGDTLACEPSSQQDSNF